MTLFTVPTSEGVATVACVDPSADCESIANTLKLNAGTAFPVGPSKEYAAGLGKTLGTLDKKANAGRKALAGRGHPEGAGGRGEGPLGRVQQRRRRRSRSSRSRRPTRAVNQQLAPALKQTGNAYGKLASAASSGNKSAYNKARASVQSAEQAVAGRCAASRRPATRSPS